VPLSLSLSLPDPESDPISDLIAKNFTSSPAATGGRGPFLGKRDPEPTVIIPFLLESICGRKFYGINSDYNPLSASAQKLYLAFLIYPSFYLIPNCSALPTQISIPIMIAALNVFMSLNIYYLIMRINFPYVAIKLLD